MGLATAAAGIRYKNRADVLLVTLAPGTRIAGIFTKSKIPSAPVDWCRRHSEDGSARALLVNSGNANAFTGKAGADAAKACAEAAAKLVDCRASDVFLASTGVIGEPLPADKITRALPNLVRDQAADGWRGAAEAIMTTDTFPKLGTASAMIDDARVRINGIAKGSGMIAPDMATMLAFVFTDANLDANVMDALLREAATSSFNSITVDSDTSTSDTLLFFATGKAGSPIMRLSDPRLADFRVKFRSLLLDLALQVVSDGEGAQKLIEVNVLGAKSQDSARKIALSVANSPLVKTAIGGGDANWGRVVMAVGKSGEPADRDRLKIWFGKTMVADKGARAAKYRESAASRAVSGRRVSITIDIGLGEGRASIYTCDFTEGYIRINGDYRS